MVQAPTLHRLLFLALLVGLGLSIYSAAESLLPSTQVCNVNPFLSCGKVAASPYSSTFGIPDWAIGLGGFVLMLGLDVPLLRSYDPRFLYAIVGLAAVGLAVSAGFAFVELALIRALCPVCLGAYVTDAAALGLGLGLVRMRRGAEDAAEEAPREGSAPGGRRDGSAP